MKSGFTRKLIGYFVLVILSFALVLTVMFILMFRNETVKNVETTLANRADNIAQIVSLDDLSVITMRTMMSYTSILGDLNNSKVWILDATGTILKTNNDKGMGMHQNIGTLSAEAQVMVKSVLAGNKMSTQSLSDLFGEKTVTVGTPILSASGQVIGAVLVSASSSTIAGVADKGITLLLISSLIGLILAIGLGYFLSKRITKPLIEMNEAALLMTSGNYSVDLKSRSNDEIGQLTDNLKTLSDRLDEASRQSANLEKMRQNFIADITHELRTPVTVLRGLAEGLRDGVLPQGSSTQEVSAQMIRECAGMSRLIGDLLELSRLEDPDFKLVTQTIDLHDIISDALRSGKQLAMAKNIQLNSDIEAGDWRINGDYDRLRQMITAVLDNAVKFTPVNQSIDVTAVVRDKHVILTVHDTGTGMSEETQAKIFTRYVRSSADNPTGSGLGLAIVSNIAKRHSIDVQVASTLGKGTDFSFVIPLIN